MKSRMLVLLTALAAAASFAAPSSADHEQVYEATYAGGGTAVVKETGRPPAADEGVLACAPGGSLSLGGGCVAFGKDPDLTSVLVNDVTAGTDVAFQVCLDNNGDGRCVSPDEGPCADQIFFSHDDGGRFFNPLGPLPTAFAPGCRGGEWHGYVVFLCEGAHVAGADGTGGVTHAHPVVHGTISTLNGWKGTGYGTFCGGSRENQSSKQYVVVR